MSGEMIIKGMVRTIKISEPILYVDNQARGRSGHMGHPMVSLGGGKIMDFNSNVSATRCSGHSGFGWMEYRISEDYGETFGEIRHVPYSMQALLEGMNSEIIEAAVACDDGTVVAFCNTFSQEQPVCCEPFGKPMYVRSLNGGKTWEEEKQLSDYKGRIYSAVYHNGKIYVLEFCNDYFLGKTEDHLYRIFSSDDNGVSFSVLSVVPFPSTYHRGYGAMIADQQGNLIVYAYNQDCEEELDYAISVDGGKTWDRTGTCYLAKRIRNPQIGLLDGQFILHGREAVAVNSFVVYTSANGLVWDEGHRIVERCPGTSFYSNNLLVEKGGTNRLLVQYSQTFCQEDENIDQTWGLVNVYHRWIESLG